MAPVGLTEKTAGESMLAGQCAARKTATWTGMTLDAAPCTA
jgi:alkyl sulfatase BDS1-like metallo-beta-lactamase superfamily hydrolase